MILEILKYPDKRLKKAAEEVTSLNDQIKNLIKDMLDTMYSAPGVGLAATQVGVALRAAVIDIKPPDKGRNPLTLLNPVILKKSNEIEFEEGCLSIPGIRAKVKRFSNVMVEFFDSNWNRVSINAEGLLAIAIQHEIDHLNGVLFIDRLTPIQKKLLKPELKRFSQKKDPHQAV